MADPVQSPHATLNYEVWMMHVTQEQLARWDPVSKEFKRESETNRMLYCAVLESFLVHARNLLGFFYTRAANDDLTAEMFFATAPPVWPARTKPARVSEWQRLMNKQLQHMTTSRRAESPEWEHREIRDHLDELIAEFNQLQPIGGPVIGVSS